MRTAALGYVSVSPGRSPDAPEADEQRRAIGRGCRALGLQLVDLACDPLPEEGEAPSRPALVEAIRRIEAGEAACLVVSELTRLAASAEELEPVIDRLQRAGLRLVALDVGLDTATDEGRLALARGAGVRPQPAWELEPPVAPAPAEAAEAGPAPPTGPPAAQADPALRALGYASIPADREAGATEELEAQRAAIEAACAGRGLELVELVREREPATGKALDRPGLSYVIERLAAGDAGCLVVSGLDRVSRSVAELGTLIHWLERGNLRLVAVELDLDTVSPAGRVAARVLASVGDWERERLSERTRKGLAAARAKRRSAAAGDLDWPAVRKRIALMRADGMTLQAIADVLNEEGVPTPRGGAKWRPSSVQAAAGYRRRSRPRTVTDLPSPPAKRPPRPAE